ncbi:YicC/YloC family endoribonuclease [Hypericibacter sp.]|uniref:YicC/YloC family endoribonuclease n=1 Tax=Hypericibacter sp. TaxID=2705401 RepID=UPI003D6C9C3F
MTKSASAVASMTGFARAEMGEGDRRWSWEIRSVNGRNLDLRLRLPPGCEALEPQLRQAVPERCRRGNISVQLEAARQGQPQSRYRVNRAALDQVIAAVKDVGLQIDAERPRLDGLLALPGVVERIEEEETEDTREARLALLLKGFGEALDGLVRMRAEEGARLARIALDQLREIERLVGRARSLAAAQPEAQKARFRLQIGELLAQIPALSEDRLAQEFALLIAKSDVREELDRLAAHIEASRALVEGGGAIGRKLDFLCQELNREANTICSKSADLELTAVGLDLKAVVEQFREQVQNIE